MGLCARQEEKLEAQKAAAVLAKATRKRDKLARKRAGEDEALASKAQQEEHAAAQAAM